jgi:hypothetical protein
MGVPRYSRDTDVKRWQHAVEELQARCHWYDGSPTIGEIIEHGVNLAQWRCRSLGWKPDGKDMCHHASDKFRLDKFGPRITVSKLRWKFVCSACGRNRPFLELWPD